VTTHAFFKALLFLGAGSVIHAMGGEQDIRRMGGLKGKIKITFITMLIGTIAISGIPPFSGFFSKDEILAHTFEEHKVLWVLGMIASMLTAFYMFRLLFLTFFGKFRGTHEQEHHLHESPASMTIPLVVLAALSIVGGLLGLPEFWQLPNWMHHQLQPVIARPHFSMLSHETEWLLMGIAVAAALVMIYITWLLFMKKKVLPAEREDLLKPWQKLIYNKYYVDEVYEAGITKPINVIGKALYEFFDKQIIDGLVNGVGNLVKGAGSLIRLYQNGNIGFYVMNMALGVILIVLLTFIIK
jgi:NADH-quinone oxidoreductase subunit L